MHLSGVILLLTCVMPPAWALDAYGAAPAGDPSADIPPFAIAAAVLSCCVGFHVLVQIPSGLLATRLVLGRGGLTTYAASLAIAGALTAAALPVALRMENVGEVMRVWTDFMLRGSLGLAGYVGMARRSRETTRT